MSVSNFVWEEYFSPYFQISPEEKTYIQLSLQDASSEVVQRIAQCSTGIYVTLSEINRELVSRRLCPFDQSFKDAFHLACYALTNNYLDQQFISSKEMQLSADIFKRGSELSLILLPRYGVKHPKSNLLGRGAEKNVFFAILINKVNGVATSVIPVAQYVPSGGAVKFTSGVLESIGSLAQMGPNCLQSYFQLDGLLEKGCEVDQLVCMPFWSGGDLKHYSSAVRNNLDPDKLFEEHRLIAYQVAMGIDQIHSKGEVHGDIKLKNCLYSSSGRIISTCVADGDTMRPVNEDAPLFQRFFYGTIHYTCPEMLLKIYDPLGGGQKADAYAFGVLLYVLVMGFPMWFYAIQDCFKQHRAKVIEIARKWWQVHQGRTPKERSLCEIYVKEVTELLKDDPRRIDIINQQNGVSANYKNLLCLTDRSPVEEFHLMILGLLLPVSAERWTIKQVLDYFQRFPPTDYRDSIPGRISGGLVPMECLLN